MRGGRAGVAGEDSEGGEVLRPCRGRALGAGQASVPAAVHACPGIRPLSRPRGRTPSPPAAQIRQIPRCRKFRQRDSCRFCFVGSSDNVIPTGFALSEVPMTRFLQDLLYRKFRQRDSGRFCFVGSSDNAVLAAFALSGSPIMRFWQVFACFRLTLLPSALGRLTEPSARNNAAGGGSGETAPPPGKTMHPLPTPPGKTAHPIVATALCAVPKHCPVHGDAAPWPQRPSPYAPSRPYTPHPQGASIRNG